MKIYLFLKRLVALIRIVYRTERMRLIVRERLAETMANYRYPDWIELACEGKVAEARRERKRERGELTIDDVAFDR